MSLNEKMNVYILVSNELKNAEHFDSTIRSTMKSTIHHAKHIGLGLHSVVLCTISAFWTVTDVYSADNV